MSKTEKTEAWFGRRQLTLDLAKLSNAERAEGSMFLGGSQAQYVAPPDKFEFSEVGTVVFEWGDPRAEDVFASMLEHDDNPNPDHLISFSASTVISDQLWMLALQDREFDPAKAYRSSEDYIEMPFDKDAGEIVLQDFTAMIPTHVQLIGRVGTRWVLFEIGMKLGDQPDGRGDSS